jgi:preprotein translocase subunit SecG
MQKVHIFNICPKIYTDYALHYTCYSHRYHQSFSDSGRSHAKWPGKRSFGGLAGNMSMGSGNMIGARRTADFLSKATSFLGGALLLLCLIANFAIDRQTTQQRSVIQQGAPIIPPDNQDFSLPAETPSAVPQGRSRINRNSSPLSSPAIATTNRDAGQKPRPQSLKKRISSSSTTSSQHIFLLSYTMSK